MLHMVMARIAAIILLFSACAVFAQTPALSTLTVVVTDQSGANVPGAHIKATAKANGERFEAIADARGKAVIQLCQGSYELTVQSEGFKTWDEKEVKVNVETQRSVILLIGDGCTICVIPDVLGSVVTRLVDVRNYFCERSTCSLSPSRFERSCLGITFCPSSGPSRSMGWSCPGQS